MPRVIADLHIHSRFSRAVSREINIPNLAQWAEKKGIGLMGTGDFTQPVWFKEIRAALQRDERGLYRYPDRPGVAFVPTTELSSIYRRGERTRRVHSVIILPSFESVERFSKRLADRGAKLASDGRPILGLDVREIMTILQEVDEAGLMIPAHIWTPWFSLFGSNSGFDSLEECFGDLAPLITAVETGLSSDPPMNWRLSQLDRCAILSFSDSHSLPNLGREATIFELAELSYKNLASALRQENLADRITETIEFYPEEGRYHWDGHRACDVSLPPAKTKQQKGLCPVCHRPLVVGVAHRVDDLADRPVTFVPKDRPPFRRLVPLQEIIAEVFSVGKQSKRVQAEYERLITQGGGELPVLLERELAELATFVSADVVEGVRRVRRGHLHIAPGYDGVYGRVSLFSPEDRKQLAQGKLFN